MFSLTDCGYCQDVTNLMNSMGISTYDIQMDQMDNAEDIGAVVNAYTGNQVVPKVYVAGEYVGGFN